LKLPLTKFNVSVNDYERVCSRGRRQVAAAIPAQKIFEKNSLIYVEDTGIKSLLPPLPLPQMK